MKRSALKRATVAMAVCGVLAAAAASRTRAASEPGPSVNQVLEWNRIFIDTLIATGTPNSSSQRLGAIVHTAIFDAYNGIDRRYTAVFVEPRGPRSASRRAAVVAAAHAALVGLFPTQQAALDARYATSLEALTEQCEARSLRGRCGRRVEAGVAWGREVAAAVLGWRSTDGFAGAYPAFTGGTATGQWRPTPPAFSAMSAQSLAFTTMFVLASNTQFQPLPPRTLSSTAYVDDFNAVKSLGRRTGSTRTDEQTALAPFWEGNASVHWNQAANQIAGAHRLSLRRASRLLAVLNIAMADTAFTIWSAKRSFGAMPAEVTWRPVTAIPLADADSHPGTAPDPEWLPLVTTPSHPEYPAGHPGQNGAAATVLRRHFSDAQTFTLTTPAQPDRTYHRISQARADGNNARVWGGMHYPSTVAVSDGVGEAIARHVDRTAMRPHGGR
jgi:hypothetical protein